MPGYRPFCITSASAGPQFVWDNFIEPLYLDREAVMLFVRGIPDVSYKVENGMFVDNFEESGVDLYFRLFTDFEGEAERLLKKDLVGPGYDYVIKCSHAFNMLEARGAISVTERTGYIARVRRLSRLSAQAFLRQRERLGYPLIADEAERERLIEAAKVRAEKARARTEKAQKKSKDSKNKKEGKNKKAKETV